FHVTGVQTCALPISAVPPSEASAKYGPLIWVNANLPQGNPPNGKLERSSSAATNTIAIHSGAAGNLLTRAIAAPATPTNNASTTAPASQGHGPNCTSRKSCSHPSSGSRKAIPNSRP